MLPKSPKENSVRRKTEQPVTVPTKMGCVDETKTTHPAYGQIVASRVTGSTSLYGSDFLHNAYMTITIRRSELNRGLSRDWYFAGEELIEVALSEAQWATFLSSPNVGSGVPCTIDHINRVVIPGLPDPIDRSKQFAGELDGTLKECTDAIEAMLEKMTEMGLPKGKTAELKGMLAKVHQELTCNLPFVGKQFGEHVEDTVEKAKQEVHGYMLGVIQRTGIAALQGMPLPLQIEAKE